MRISKRVVDPLDSEPEIMYKSDDLCDEAALDMEMKYEKILEDYMHLGNHKGQAGSNKWSPEDGKGNDPLTQDDINDWMFNDL